MGFPKLGVPFGSPNSKDHSMLGSLLGSPYFGKLPFSDVARVQGFGVYWSSSSASPKRFQS